MNVNPTTNQGGTGTVSFSSFLFGRRDGEGNTIRRRSRQVFRINYWSVLAEWTSSAIALSLLCFYSSALLSASDDDQTSLSFKLLAANVILSVYMRACYILHSASKTYVLVKEGPVDTSVLPMQTQINGFSSLMGFVEPGHFVCLCWITHVAFPFKQCDDLSAGSAVCTSLHITSTIFVSMWIFTGLAFIVLIACFARWDHTGVGRNVGNTNSQTSSAPPHVRAGAINSLPLTTDAPPDGEVCAICCERELGDQPTQWRLLPCGHRFHPTCVDEWLKKQGGTCPTCRRDPVAQLEAAAAANAAQGNSAAAAPPAPANAAPPTNAGVAGSGLEVVIEASAGAEAAAGVAAAAATERHPLPPPPAARDADEAAAARGQQEVSLAITSRPAGEEPPEAAAAPVPKSARASAYLCRDDDAGAAGLAFVIDATDGAGGGGVVGAGGAGGGVGVGAGGAEDGPRQRVGDGGEGEKGRAGEGEDGRKVVREGEERKLQERVGEGKEGQKRREGEREEGERQRVREGDERGRGSGEEEVELAQVHSASSVSIAMKDPE